MVNIPPNPPSADTDNFSQRTDPVSDSRIPLVYVLPSSDMYGTERMALATAVGLEKEFRVIFMGPLGPAIFEARRLGFEARVFQTTPQYIRTLFKTLWEFQSLIFVSTLPRQCLICGLLNFPLRKKVRKIHMIHGGGNEQMDYGRLRPLKWFDVTYVAVSDYGRERLLHHGIRADHIAVVGNFFARRQLDAMPRRPRYGRDGVRDVVLVSRVDPPKRVDLLLDALDKCGEQMRDVSFRVLGWGPDLDRLSARAKQTHPNVTFAGYVDNIPEELSKADLLLHTCPVETFGIAVLEAMSIHLPALVPDAGGTAALVCDGQTGFTFRANDADHLAARLVELKNAPAELLNKVAHDAQVFSEQFSEEASIAKYREVFAPH
jgi:glycosyltransferase involved in cell wall biosynthesis